MSSRSGREEREESPPHGIIIIIISAFSWKKRRVLHRGVGQPEKKMKARGSLCIIYSASCTQVTNTEGQMLLKAITGDDYICKCGRNRVHNPRSATTHKSPSLPLWHQARAAPTAPTTTSALRKSAACSAQDSHKTPSLRILSSIRGTATSLFV